MGSYGFEKVERIKNHVSFKPHVITRVNETVGSVRFVLPQRGDIPR